MPDTDPMDLVAARRRLRRTESHFVTVAGVDIHLLDEGPRDAALTVVLPPAQWLSALSTDRWARIVAERYRVLRIDMPGHGLSGPFPDGDHGPRAYANLLGAILVALDPGPYVVVGSSFSGIATALHAATAPRDLRGLVLATSSGLARPPGGPAPNQPPPDPNWADETRRRPPAFYAWKLGTLLRRPMAPEDHAALLDEVAIFNELPGRMQEARLRVAHHDPAALADALPRIAVPLLVQWSSGSTYLPPAMADQIAALAPGPATVRHYADTGHLLLLDAPEETARDLIGFLEGLS